MKSLVVAVFLAAPPLNAATTSAPVEPLQSPDQRITVSVALQNGLPHWQATRAGEPLILTGALGIGLSRNPLCGPFTLEQTRRTHHDSTWRPVWGDRSEVRDHYNELLVTLRETGGNRRIYQIVLRAYDEGLACRYIVPAQPGMERVGISKRLTEYRFPDNNPIYQTRNCQYGTVGIDTMSKSEGNVTVDAGGGRFVSLTDADRADFPSVAWEHARHSAATIIGTLHSAAEGTLPIQTSWEVMIVGDTLGKLYENRFIVENLNPPCAIADTAWIRPGKAICQVRNTRMVTDELKALLDFASAHRIEYLEIDHSWNGAETKWTPGEIANFEARKKPFWDHHPEWRDNIKGNPMVAAKGYVPFRPDSYEGGNFVDLDVPALCAYGKSLCPPVGVCVYVRGALFKEFGGDHPMDEVFAAYEKMGLSGIKPGFVPPGSQYNERMIARMVKKAAEHKLIMTIHDAFHPYGLSRTYPNLMNVEGGAGEEAEHSIRPEMKSLHDVMLVFTRILMGPFDYTPEIGKTSKTHCHQVSMVSLYQGRASIRGGMRQWSPGGEWGAEIEFVEKWPGLFDETRVTAEINESVTMAKRRGATWHVASMSGPKARSYAYPLDFLIPGKTYQASIHSDVSGSMKSAHTRRQVTCQTVMQISMEPNGGHLMILEPEDL